MNWFNSKPTLKETQRENNKVLRKTNRDVDRERRELEAEEKKLEMEIKKCAKAGNKEACTVLAKQLVRIRKQKTRTYTMNSKIQGVSSQNRVLGANVKLTEAMSTTTKTMQSMNNIMKPEKVAADMRAFQQVSARMNMTDEMINDTLDDIMNESGDEEESDAVVQQVLDEIGIDISGRLAAVPSVSDSLKDSSKAKLPSDADIEKILQQLRN